MSKRIHNINRLVLAVAMMLSGLLHLSAQGNRTFEGKVFNSEFSMWLEMDFYGEGVKMPAQEIFGQVPGYFATRRDGRKWIVTDAKIDGEKAYLTVINDYGSEDFTAVLYYKADGTYQLERKSGSTMKVVENRKWVKIPKTIVFTRKGMDK